MHICVSAVIPDVAYCMLYSAVGKDILSHSEQVHADYFSSHCTFCVLLWVAETAYVCAWNLQLFDTYVQGN